tara:strand:+ start:1037 stop:1339 length:303 start_codon:yes stop_codon:yes gene_type:complete
LNVQLESHSIEDRRFVPSGAPFPHKFGAGAFIDGLKVRFEPWMTERAAQSEMVGKLMVEKRRSTIIAIIGDDGEVWCKFFADIYHVIVSSDTRHNTGLAC